MTTVTLPNRTALSHLTRPGNSPLVARVAAAALLLGVAYIHLADQGFLAFDKHPSYLLASYLLVEVAAPLAALALLRFSSVATWLVALGCAAGPMLGYVLTRSIGLPGATEDIGNWGEPLGVASLVVEGALLLLALASAWRVHQSVRSTH